MAQPGAASTAAAPKQRLSRTARIGIAAVAVAATMRIVLGNFVVNEWEGWGTFVPNAVGAVIEGLVLGGVIFGLVVRLAAKRRGSVPAVTGLVFGILGVLSLAIPYSAPQPIVGAAAVALGLVGLEPPHGSSRIARPAIVLGLLVIGVWLAFMAYAVVTGDWPVNY